MTPKTTIYRKASLADLLGEDDNSIVQNNNYNYSQNDNTLSKHQQEFGHKKRIKP